MTAERLRQAADLLDSLITEATPGPWAVSPEEFTFGTEVIWYDPNETDSPEYTGTGVACGASFGEGVCATADAAYIAAMHRIGLAILDRLYPIDTDSPTGRTDR